MPISATQKVFGETPSGLGGGSTVLHQPGKEDPGSTACGKRTETMPYRQRGTFPAGAQDCPACQTARRGQRKEAAATDGGVSMSEPRTVRAIAGGHAMIDNTGRVSLSTEAAVASAAGIAVVGGLVGAMIAGR